MQQEDRLALMCVWNGVVVFVSGWYLTGSLIKSAVIAIFVLVSCLLGYGVRWLLRGGFAVSIFAIAVAVGAIPRPDQWKNLVGGVRKSLEHSPDTARAETPWLHFSGSEQR
jgi:hypothetical protein